MARIRSHIFIAFAVGTPLTCATLARADESFDNQDQNRALDLYERGEIKPLTQVLQRVGEASPGDIVDVTLEPSGARWIYRLKIVTSTGTKVLLGIDAASLEIISDGQ